MCIFLAWQAGIASLFSVEGYSNLGAGIAGLVSIFLFSGAFSASFGPGKSDQMHAQTLLTVSLVDLPVRDFPYEPESARVRSYLVFCKTVLIARRTAVSTASNWLNNIIIGQITPVGFDKLGWKYFFVYVATNASNAVVSFFLFPEVRGPPGCF
jgi:hypothetical protein